MQNNQQKTAAHLFYSKSYCEHSKRCLDRITKNGLTNQIKLWNIDDPGLNIPPFVQSVPTIYLADQRRVLVNKDLFDWIDQHNANTHNNYIEPITGDSNILAWSSGELAGNAGFAFLDDNQNDQMDSSFEFLNGSNKDKARMVGITRIDGIPNGGQSGGVISSSGDEKKAMKSDMEKAYQRMQEERNAEMKNTIGAMRV